MHQKEIGKRHSVLQMVSCPLMCSSRQQRRATTAASSSVKGRLGSSKRKSSSRIMHSSGLHAFTEKSWKFANMSYENSKAKLSASAHHRAVSIGSVDEAMVGNLSPSSFIVLTLATVGLTSQNKMVFLLTDSGNVATFSGSVSSSYNSQCPLYFKPAL